MLQCGWHGLTGERPAPGRQVGSEGEGRGTERYAGGGGDAPPSTTTRPGGRTAARWILRDRSSAPQGFMKFADFMFKAGMIKLRPSSWKEDILPRGKRRTRLVGKRAPR